MRPRVDVATGSLGQGLPDAVGVGLAGKYLDKLPYHVWVLCGDSETAEGSCRRGDAQQFARHPVGGGVSRRLALALTCGAAPSCDLQTLAPLTGGSFQGWPVPQVPSWTLPIRHLEAHVSMRGRGSS